MHDGVWVAAGDHEFAVRLARYCARNPVALSRLEYQSDNATVTYHSDKPAGSTAGSEPHCEVRTLNIIGLKQPSTTHLPFVLEKPYLYQRPA